MAETENKPSGVVLKYDENNPLHHFLRSAGIATVSILTLLLVWWFVSLALRNPALPTPIEVFEALIYLFTVGDTMSSLTMWDNMSISLQRFAVGFLMAFVLAVPLGLVLGSSPKLNEFATPIYELIRPIAPIAWAPIFLFMFGARTSPSMVVAIGIFFPLLTNTIFGVTKIDPSHVDAAKTLGANGLQRFLKVTLPSGIPYIMNGIRIGLGVGWMCIVAAEMIVPIGGGIGYFISIQAQQYMQYTYCWAGIVVICILGLLTTTLADRVYKLITRRMGIDAD
jgi:NitT/TauT family transport system permease protein